MAISAADLKKYHSLTNSSTAGNGGAINLNSAITSGVKENIFPKITDAERIAGVTKYRKVYLRNENADAYTSVKCWIQAGTPSTDSAITISGAGSFSQQGNDVEITGITFSFTNNSADVTAQSDCHLAVSVGERIFNSSDDTNTSARVISAIAADGLTITLASAYPGTSHVSAAATVCAATGNTFVSPNTISHADVLDLGTLTQDQSVGVWIKYVVDATSAGYVSDTFTLRFSDVVA